MSDTERHSREFAPGQGLVESDKAKASRGFQMITLVPCTIFATGAIVVFIIALTSVETDTLARGMVGSALALIALGFGLAWASLSIVRSVVTRDELQVQLGIWGPEITLEDIRRVRVVPAPTKLQIGESLEGERQVSSYVVARRDHVEVLYLGDEGDERLLRFSANDPEAVVQAIERARDGRIAESQRYSSASWDPALTADDLDDLDEPTARS